MTRINEAGTVVTRSELESMRKDAERYRWLPIETAPAKGDFLVYIPSVEGWLPVHSARRFDNGATVLSGDADEDGEPTHWMPLPDTPEGQP